MKLVRSRPVRGALMFAALLAAAAACVPTPDVTAAPPGTPQPSNAALAGPKGYTESEFFVTGTANRYREVGAWGNDGRWEKEVAEGGVPYATRLIVNRPSDPARFNGTVWVEWLNVSSGSDIAPSFTQARDHILASGAAWVGVSAQRAGLESVKGVDPARYGALNIPNDGFSYDIFAQAGKAVRELPDVLGGLEPQRVIAAGESQSAFRMVTYVNAFSMADDVYDGYMIHSRFAPAAPLGDGFFGAVSSAKIRPDVEVPVFQLQTESDLGGWEAVRQPDSERLATWEVAGAAHADVYTVASAAGNPDIDAGGVAWLMGCAKSVNAFPFHYAANAGYAALERWVRDGARPPAAPPLEIVGNVIQRDAEGNARGGLRLPDIDVPVAAYNAEENTALEAGSFFCSLFGTTRPFTPAQLAARYPAHADYVRAYTSRADAAVAAGFMTQADRDAAVAAANTRPIPA